MDEHRAVVMVERAGCGVKERLLMVLTLANNQTLNVGRNLNILWRQQYRADLLGNLGSLDRIVRGVNGRYTRTTYGRWIG
jgi:hypothetical protein